MKTKAQILKAYIDKGADAKSDAHLSMLTVVGILEILIDIRDNLTTIKYTCRAVTEHLEKLP